MEPVPEDSNLPTSSKNGDTGGLSRPASAKKKTHSTGMSMYLNVGGKGKEILLRCYYYVIKGTTVITSRLNEIS